MVTVRWTKLFSLLVIFGAAQIDLKSAKRISPNTRFVSEALWSPINTHHPYIWIQFPISYFIFNKFINIWIDNILGKRAVSWLALTGKNKFLLSFSNQNNATRLWILISEYIRRTRYSEQTYMKNKEGFVSQYFPSKPRLKTIPHLKFYQEQLYFCFQRNN